MQESQEMFLRFSNKNQMIKRNQELRRKKSKAKEEENQKELNSKTDIGWGMRSEWLIKYLTQLAAKKGVDILNRTRVSNIFFEDNFLRIQAPIQFYNAQPKI